MFFAAWFCSLREVQGKEPGLGKRGEGGVHPSTDFALSKEWLSISKTAVFCVFLCTGNVLCLSLGLTSILSGGMLGWVLDMGSGSLGGQESLQSQVLPSLVVLLKSRGNPPMPSAWPLCRALGSA